MHLSKQHDQIMLLPEQSKPSNPWKAISFLIAILFIGSLAYHISYVLEQEVSDEPSKTHTPTTANSTILTALKAPKQDHCQIEDANRFDCDPNPSSSENKCMALGCCWKKPGTQKVDAVGKISNFLC
jgi:hypothetical protein